MLSRLLLFVFCCAVFLPAQAAQKNRPNFVFILVDDLRVGTLSCEGHPFSRTPNIDRIAKEGARFQNAFVTTPLCSPARAGFLTGQYAHTHRVVDNADHRARSHELITFPLLLRKAGYESAYVGKWHMGGHDEPKPGYDHWVSFKGQGVYENPMININGTAQKVAGYMTDIVSEHAADFVKRPHTKPFVLFIGHKAVHGPFTPAERHKNLYQNEVVEPGPSRDDSLEGKAAIRKVREMERKGKPAPASSSARKEAPTRLILAQLRCLKAIDDGVGKILAALEETKQLDNTVVIFTSDNGYFWGEHGLGDKRWAYEESIRIPMLMRYPALIKAGALPAQMILNVDIAPTFLDLAGAKAEKNMHGKSMVPVLSGRARGWRETALFEYFVDREYPRFPEWQAARTDRWKYIRYTEQPDADELYDLKADPFELKNLAQEKSAGKTLSSMKAELERLVKQTK